LPSLFYQSHLPGVAKHNDVTASGLRRARIFETLQMIIRSRQICAMSCMHRFELLRRLASSHSCSLRSTSWIFGPSCERCRSRRRWSFGSTWAENVVTALRWKAVVRALGASLDGKVVLRAVLLSFFSQALPSTFGGYIVRLSYGHPGGVRFATTVSSIPLDRISAPLFFR
jgi:hypothetical protein